MPQDQPFCRDGGVARFPLNSRYRNGGPCRDNPTVPKQILPDGVSVGNQLLLDSLQHRIYAPFPGGIAELDTRSGQFRPWPFAPLGQQGTVDTYYGIPIARRANGELLTVAPGQLVAFSPHTHRFRTTPIPNAMSTHFC